MVACSVQIGKTSSHKHKGGPLLPVTLGEGIHQRRRGCWLGALGAIQESFFDPQNELVFAEG